MEGRGGGGIGASFGLYDNEVSVGSMLVYMGLHRLRVTHPERKHSSLFLFFQGGFHGTSTLNVTGGPKQAC